jgi:hypothetical protein
MGAIYSSARVSSSDRVSGRAWYFVCLVLWVVTLVLLPWLNPFGPSWIRTLAFIGALAGSLSLFIGLGLGVAEDVLGVLQDGRNTYSLSRLQMALWTLLILSALIAITVCRAWGLFSGSTLATAFDVYVPPALYAAMGISYFSGAAAPAILSLKSQSPSTAGQVAFASERMGQTIRVTGRVIHRPLSADPILADIVQGDDIATAGTVDLSKVQQLLITMLLLVMYLAVLVGLFVNGPAPAGDEVPKNLMSLPDFPLTFLTLMAISHGGYLAFKAVPASAPASAASAGALQRPNPPATR